MRAVVRNGRLQLDEPTTLPEGTVVELDAIDADGWTLNDADAAELRDRAQSGASVPAEVVFASKVQASK
jgi:hypothetical protein